LKHSLSEFVIFSTSRNYVLEQSDTIEDFGLPRWKLLLCLLLAWIVVWLVLLKGIQSLGKVHTNLHTL